MVLAIGIFLSTTTIGLQLIISAAERFTPGNLHVGSISGALNRVIILKDFHYKNQQFTITSPQLQLRIRPLALLLNKLYVGFLQADTLHITQFTAHQAQRRTTTTTPKFILPIKLKLKHIAFKQLILQQDDKQYQLNHFMLSTFIKSNRIDVSSLQSDIGENHYSLQGKLNLSSLHLVLHVSQRKHDTLVWQGTIHAAGNWKKLTVRSVLNTPLSIKTTMIINNLLTAPTWQLTGQIKTTELKRIPMPRNYANITGTFSGKGNTKVANFSAKLIPDMSMPSGYLSAHLNSKSLQQKQFAATLRWHNLALPNINREDINSLQGYISVSGRPTSYHFNSNITMSGIKFPHGTWQLHGDGDLHHLALTDLKADLLDGSLTATANVNWQSTLSYALHFDVQHLHPQQQWINWHGDVSLRGILQGSQDSTKLSVTNLHGYLRQQRLSGSLSAHIMNHQLVAAISNVSMGAAKFNFVFSRQHQLQTWWDINIPSLAKLMPYGSGRLVSQGQLQQTATSPSIKGSISGKDLAWFSYQLGMLNSDFTLAINPNHRSKIHLQATKIRLLNYSLNSVKLIAAGTLRQQQINLQISANQKKLYAQTLGHYKNKQWQLHFIHFTLANDKKQTWQLLKPFNVYYAKDTLKLNNFIWQSGAQMIKVDFNWQQQVLQKLRLNLRDVSLSLFNPFLPDTMHLQGKLNLQADYNQQTTSGNLSANLQNGKIYYPIKKHQQVFIINSAQWQASVNKAQLQNSLKLKFVDHNYLNANLSSTNFNLQRWLDKQTHWQGELQTHLDKLEFLTLVFPTLQILNGELNAQIKWNGTLQTPHLQGYAKINHGLANLPEQEIQLKAISLNATAAANKIVYQLTATSGKGTLIIDGNSHLNKHHKTDLQITGNNVTFINTSAYQIVASPKLHLLVQNNLLYLSGDLYLPTISINKSDYLDVITLPSDIIVTQRADESRNDTLWGNLHTKIKLTLGKNVYFQNNQLNAQLSGSLLLNKKLKHDMHANGELTVNNGTFTVFGQQLTIKNGKLIYVGGLVTNPGLDIKATKTITTFVNATPNSLTQTSLTTEQKTPSQQLNTPLQQKIITVGIKVSNSLDDPHIALFSDEPGLSGADILSYLLLGYPLDKASNGEAQALWNAISSLSANNRGMGNTLVTKIKHSFDLDQIGIQSNVYFDKKTNTVQHNTSLVLGKMLLPKLSINYSIGLIEPINTLSATYQVNKYWSTQAKTNSLAKSIDIIYSHEKK